VRPIRWGWWTRASHVIAENPRFVESSYYRSVREHGLTPIEKPSFHVSDRSFDVHIRGLDTVLADGLVIAVSAP
jgi:hypothetical protein